jgi:hypothetical protein
MDLLGSMRLSRTVMPEEEEACFELRIAEYPAMHS